MFKEIGDGGVENKKEDSSVNKLSMNDEDPNLDEDDADVNIVNLKEKEGGDRSADNTITLDTYQLEDYHLQANLFLLLQQSVQAHMDLH